jgi:hypothetical protein
LYLLLQTRTRSSSQCTSSSSASCPWSPSSRASSTTAARRTWHSGGSARGVPSNREAHQAATSRPRTDVCRSLPSSARPVVRRPHAPPCAISSTSAGGSHHQTTQLEPATASVPSKPCRSVNPSPRAGPRPCPRLPTAPLRPRAPTLVPSRRVPSQSKL